MRSPIEAEIVAAHARGNLRAFDYVVRDQGGNIQSVLCKICGTVISTRVGRKLRQTAAYREIVFNCSDGSQHISAVCSCAQQADPETLRDAYLADIADFYHHEGAVGEMLARQYFMRLPQSVARQADRRGPQRTPQPVLIQIAEGKP